MRSTHELCEPRTATELHRASYGLRKVHAVPVDSTPTRADSALVQLGAAIEVALDGRTKGWLAEQVGVDASTIGRIINGRLKDLKLLQVRAIEDHLGVSRGFLLRAGGFVDEAVTVEAAIASDPTIHMDDKATLVRVISQFSRPEPAT